MLYMNCPEWFIFHAIVHFSIVRKTMIMIFVAEDTYFLVERAVANRLIFENHIRLFKVSFFR